MGLSVPDLRVVSFVLLFGSVLPAQAEVSTCKEITALPAIVNTSGVWCLTKNLAWGGTTGKAIDVQVGTVTIDLNGFTLGGSVSANTQAVGIHSINRANVTIRNGTIRGFFVGILLEGTGASNNVIEDMHLDQVRHYAIDVKQGFRTIIRNNEVTNTGADPGDNFGIFVELGAKAATISNNIVNGLAAHDVGAGITTDRSDLTEIRDNSVMDVVGGAASAGIEVNVSHHTIVQNNRVHNGDTLGNIGILGNADDISCINNVVQRFNTPITGCAFNSGNLTPP
jgi:hypothetical protein